MAIDETDLKFLGRAVELAREALDRGDDPFGSVLVGEDGRVLREDRNREISDGDETLHPEIELARWAAHNLPQEARARATVYTSGEHCPMCSAAHAWMGLGRLVYAVSASQLAQWRTGWGLPAGPVLVLSVTEVAPGVPVEGPAPELEDAMRDLHHRAAARR